MPTSDNDTPAETPAGNDGIGASIITRREVMVSLAGLAIVVLTLILGRVNASIVLITSANDSVPFPDVEASFARRIPGAGLVGLLFAANPSDACSPLEAFDTKEASSPAFILIERGGCNFVTKVQYAQDAGYAATIVYNNEDGHELVTMSGNGLGIDIPAVFVSKEAGDILLQYVGDINARLYMLPAFENTALSVMAISFISLLAVSAVLSTFLFVRRQRLRRTRRLSLEAAGMSQAEVKALPISIFNQKENANLETCTICLEEYMNGEKLRVLPCNHEFHMQCIDQWLTTRRPFCPICKRDAHANNVQSVPSERTPLLNSISMHVGSTMTSLIVSSATPEEASAAESVQNPPAGDIC